jgi:hypothetical protein
LRISIFFESWISIRISKKLYLDPHLRQNPGAEESQNGAIEGPWRLKMVPWRICITVVADMHHFDEEPDPDPHLGEKLDPDQH